MSGGCTEDRRIPDLEHAVSLLEHRISLLENAARSIKPEHEENFGRILERTADGTTDAIHDKADEIAQAAIARVRAEEKVIAAAAITRMSEAEEKAKDFERRMRAFVIHDKAYEAAKVELKRVRDAEAAVKAANDSLGHDGTHKSGERCE